MIWKKKKSFLLSFSWNVQFLGSTVCAATRSGHKATRHRQMSFSMCMQNCLFACIHSVFHQSKTAICTKEITISTVSVLTLSGSTAQSTPLPCWICFGPKLKSVQQNVFMCGVSISALWQTDGLSKSHRVSQNIMSDSVCFMDGNAYFKIGHVLVEWLMCNWDCVEN